jgi:putative transposase
LVAASQDSPGVINVDGNPSYPKVGKELKQLEAGGGAAKVGRELGVSKHTIYAWKAKYGGLEVS